MFAGDVLYWLSWLGVLMLIGALIFAAWWALFSDRRKGGKDRRRCPKCWYDMAYSPGMTCAECGFVGWRESQFHTTRRRYGVAALAIIGAVSVTLAINYRVADRGVAALLPTRMLLWLLPLAGDNGMSGKGIFGELHVRAATGQLSNDHWIAFIDRCAMGDFTARPPSQKWIGKYGNVITTLRTNFIHDAQLEPLLMKIAPSVEVSTRPTWPAGMPVTANVVVRDWWPWGMECRIRATPRFGDLRGETVTFYRTGDDRWQRSAYALDLPPLDPSTTEITIDFEIERRRMAGVTRAGRIDSAAAQANSGGGEWEFVGKHTAALKTRAQGAMDQIATGVSNELMNQAVAQVFLRGAVKWPRGQSPVRFSINPQATWLPAFDGVALGLSAELMFDGQLARRLNLWWLGGTAPGGGNFAARQYGFEIDYENLELLNSLVEGARDDRWQFRIRGLPEIALRAGNVSKYWNGDVTVPLRLQMSNDPAAPPRAWWTEEAGGDEQ